MHRSLTFSQVCELRAGRARGRIKEELEARRRADEALELEHRQERNPLYDPMRDGPPVYASQADRLLGDPPVGRRELLERGR